MFHKSPKFIAFFHPLHLPSAEDLCRKTQKSFQDTPWSSSQHKGDSFVPERQRAGIRDKDRRWRKREEGKRRVERGEKRQRREVRGICPGGGDEGGREDKWLSLDREEIDMAYRKMAVLKGKKGNPMLGWGTQFESGMLIRWTKGRGVWLLDFNTLDSWTLVVNLKRKKWPNKGIDLEG